MEKFSLYELFGVKTEREYQLYRDGIDEGIEIGRKIAWQDKDCKPICSTDVIVIFNDSSSRIVNMKQGDSFDNDVKMWAYVEDLMPSNKATVRSQYLSRLIDNGLI